MKTTGSYFSLAMAMLMLMMSMGITLHKMVCLVSGTITLSFFDNEGCCPGESENDNSLAAKCCDYTTDYFKLDIQTLVSSFDFKFDFVQFFTLLPDFSFSETTRNRVYENGYSPPLLSGKAILILVSVFRV